MEEAKELSTLAEQDNIEQTGERIATISEQSEMQFNSIAHVTQALGNISNVSKQTVALTIDTSSKIQSLGEYFAQIQSLADKFKI